MSILGLFLSVHTNTHAYKELRWDTRTNTWHSPPTARLQGCCPRRVVVHSTCSVEIHDATGAVPIFSATTISTAAAGPGRKPPLLALDLSVSKEGGRFVYSTPPPTIVTKIMALFDVAICES